MSYRLGGDLWNSVAPGVVGGNHRHARQRSQAWADSSALLRIRAFAATPRHGWLGKAPGGTTLTSPENALNHRNAPTKTALATGPALCKQAENGIHD